MYRFRALAVIAAATLMAAATAAAAFEQPLFPLNGDQLKSLHAYGGERGHKAFAASPEGNIGAATGFISATVAARQALKACDAQGKGCILIDLDGQPVPLALQYAQTSRAGRSVAEAPLPLRDLSINADVQAALEGYKEKPANKAFAISLKGPWARAWEAATPEDADREALATCNKSENAAEAPCFILMTNDTGVDPATLLVTPELTVEPMKSQ